MGEAVGGLPQGHERPGVVGPLALQPDVLFLDHVDALTDPGGDPDAHAALPRAFDAVAASVTIEAVSIIQPAIQAVVRFPRRLVQL